MKLICYALSDHSPKIVPASVKRQWMDAFPDLQPYRCLPMSIANSHGWEVLCPVPLVIDWTGGTETSAITIRALKPLPGGCEVEHLCRSHFSRGIVTFHPGYLFRTPPGWNLLATGPFNQPKYNASPLTGIVETDWLPFPFTMNWQIQRPGRVIFEEDEPFCSVFPVSKIVDVQPEIRRLSDDAEVSQQYEEFRASRQSFLERLYAGDPDTVQQAWQKHYFVGEHQDGTKADNHMGRLRLKAPIDLRGDK